ncbi:DnaJ family molecular chaperone [Silanimonas sp.]|uniref:DnaJ family molecular chaperone n=1 Tax=Silanimonas sp. TaxID=1929290 RepID=UPI0037C7CD35
MSDPFSPLDDLTRLGLPPGAPLDALKPAWRRAVSALHPDRNGPEADRELAEVNAAFQRLQAFERRYGRLPGHRDAPLRPNPSPRRGSPRWMVGSLAIAAAALILWPQAQPVDDPTRLGDEGAMDAWVPPPAVASSPAGIGLPTDRLRVGLDPEAVERLAGPPLFRSAERWEYGPSEVRFTDGKVSGWYSSALRPLPVGDTPSFPAHDHH